MPLLVSVDSCVCCVHVDFSYTNGGRTVACDYDLSQVAFGNHKGPQKLIKSCKRREVRDNKVPWRLVNLPLQLCSLLGALDLPQATLPVYTRQQ